jgi:hypothetical protein
MTAVGVGVRLCTKGLHPLTEENMIRKKGHGVRCRLCRNEYDRAKRKKSPVDGLEASYGPVPDRIPDHLWFDEVIVFLVVNGHPTPRQPHRLEWNAIFEQCTHSYPILARLTGLVERNVALKHAEWTKKKERDERTNAA